MNLASDLHPAPDWSIDRLRRHFGGIPAERIVMDPKPGTATDEDLIRWNEGGISLCELVDYCLVEKAMGARESLIAGILVEYLRVFNRAKPLGVVLPGDGAIRLCPGLVRAPDVSFISWESIGSDEFPETPVPQLRIDLAVEVVSKGNTVREIAHKIDEYFEHGTQMVWVVEPKKKTVDVYRSPSLKKRLTEAQKLTAPKILPGFSLPVRALFSDFRRPGS